MLPALSRLLAAFAVIALAALPASAQDHPRVALVIGNGAYTEAPVEEAVPGARQVADILRQGGFKVFYLENARRDEIQGGLAAFARALERGAQGLVFYSGHAVQYQGRNYLITVDAWVTGPADLRREAIDIDLMLDPLIVARTPGSIVILDASRTNPWQAKLAANVRGLAEPEPMKSIAFVCSAAPGRVVNPGTRAGSVFIEQLVEAMKTPNISIAEVVNRTRAAVARVNRDQRVWQSTPAVDLVVLSRSQVAKPADAVELGFWETIKNSTNPTDYDSYLSSYPEGQFALVARAKLDELQRRAGPSTTPTAATPKAAGDRTAAARPDQLPPATPAPPAPNLAPAAPPATPAAPIRDCPTCPELMLVPAGTMTMGASDGFAFETPVREVTIGKPFYIGRREVTFDEWDACLADGGCQYRPGDRGQGRGMRPAIDLDWNDAQAYVIWLTRKTGKNYRLPTEAEWEYAARAGSRTAYYWGNVIEKDRANCAGCNSQPLNQAMPSGTFPPNALGLVDMAGNAAEWVEDCWEDNYRNAPKDGSAVKKADCRERVLRGGSFNNDQRFARTAARFKYDFDVRYYTNGFRVAREQ
jgi:formylglycine-generating enzyme required for sulfatase activity